jgi:hypothetical protein
MRQLLGIDLNVLRTRLVEKDEYQGVAGLGHCIAALARYLSGQAACILRNHLNDLPSRVFRQADFSLTTGRRGSFRALAHKFDPLARGSHHGRRRHDTQANAGGRRAAIAPWALQSGCSTLPK